MKYPFKAKLQDSRYENLVYVIVVKNERDWLTLKSLEENPQYTVKPLTKKSKKVAENLSTA